MDNSNSDILKQLEVEGTVPEYLKESLVSEIDLIKDSLQVVALFGGGFFMALLKAISSIPDTSQENEQLI